VERAHERSAFLAEASVILGASLDHRRTLAKIARLIVPRLADWCSVDMADPDGAIQSVAVAHVDPDRVELVREYRRRFPPEPGTSGVAQVIATGEPLVLADLTPELLEEQGADPDRRAALLELGVSSIMVVPLSARGQAIGSIMFVSGDSGRRFGDEDLELGHELARRAALALDNARLYEERSHIARTLQRSLLPRRVPEIDGVSIAAVYQPAGVSQTEVGGDFYDVFEAGDDAWGIAVGDVCGKGVEAAALTGMARHTLRSFAFGQPSPSGALRDLNRVMLREDGERFCTVALGRLERTYAGLRLTVACGGHPSPLVVRRDGGVVAVGMPGSLLGVFADVVLEDVVLDLGVGDQVVLYTDGLVDPRRPTPLDDAGLRRLVASCRDRSARETAEHLGEAVADPSGEAPDDVCIVVLRVD
jgi:serine phosphatase RsbU (regulator of sigma subunit)